LYLLHDGPVFAYLTSLAVLLQYVLMIAELNLA